MRPYVGLNRVNCHRRVMCYEHIWTLIWFNVRINHEIDNVLDITAALIHELIPIDVIRLNTRSMRSKVFTLHGSFNNDTELFCFCENQIKRGRDI